MNGIVEVVAALMFVGTFLFAFVLRLCPLPRPRLIVVLFGLWPLFWGLVREGRAAVRDPAVAELWLVATAITLAAALAGGWTAEKLIQFRARRQLR